MSTAETNWETSLPPRSWPQLQAAWIAAVTLASVVLMSASDILFRHPEFNLVLALGLCTAAVRPRKWWFTPIGAASALAAGSAADMVGISPVVGAGLSVACSLTWLLKEQPDALDWFNAALTGVAGAGFGLYLGSQGAQLLLVTQVQAAAQASMVALGISLVLPVLAWRPARDPFPSDREIVAALTEPYREPVFKAKQLLGAARSQAPDAWTRRGLAEVATWVFRLQTTLQTLDRELGQVNADEVNKRIAACETDDELDAFTRERKQATVVHLRRLLDHGNTLRVERGRTTALVEYATAFLEEARAGLAIAHPLPGEATPERLPEVLGRLREHASAADARRKTARELESR